MDRQQTLMGAATRSGVGVHTNAAVRLTLRGAHEGSGVVLVRSDLGEPGIRIPARRDRVGETRLGTNLMHPSSGASVATVEHLLAALSGMEIDNAIAELDGPELPIFDGSAQVFCDMIRAAGVQVQVAPRRVLKVLQAVEVRIGAAFARLAPGEGFEIDAVIDFPSRAIGRQSFLWRASAGAFERQIAFARTFGMASELDALHAMGKGRGASLDNTIAIEGDRVLNPEGLRAPDEFVRHKILDIIGDLALAGAPLEGRYEGERMGHEVNAGVLDKLLSTPGAAAWKVGGTLEPVTV